MSKPKSGSPNAQQPSSAIESANADNLQIPTNPFGQMSDGMEHLRESEAFKDTVGNFESVENSLMQISFPMGKIVRNKPKLRIFFFNPDGSVANANFRPYEIAPSLVNYKWPKRPDLKYGNFAAFNVLVSWGTIKEETREAKAKEANARLKALGRPEKYTYESFDKKVITGIQFLGGHELRGLECWNSLGERFSEKAAMHVQQSANTANPVVSQGNSHQFTSDNLGALLQMMKNGGQQVQQNANPVVQTDVDQSMGDAFGNFVAP